MKEKEKDARYTNGHLFTSITVSGMTMCFACNKSITAKEALSCPSEYHVMCELGRSAGQGCRSPPLPTTEVRERVQCMPTWISLTIKSFSHVQGDHLLPHFRLGKKFLPGQIDSGPGKVDRHGWGCFISMYCGSLA